MEKARLRCENCGWGNYRDDKPPFKRCPRCGADSPIKICVRRKRTGFVCINGYRLLQKPTHPNAHNGGLMLEHRLIMEEHIGRLLGRDEVVHHINGIRDDNRVDNLSILTKKEHSRLHSLGKKHAFKYTENSKCKIRGCDKKPCRKNLCHSHSQILWQLQKGIRKNTIIPEFSHLISPKIFKEEITMKISDQFVSAIALYSHKHENLPYYRIFKHGGYEGAHSRITHILHSSSLGESDQQIALRVGKFLNLKSEEIFQK